LALMKSELSVTKRLRKDWKKEMTCMTIELENGGADTSL
jgi:hypothetical protein